MGQEITQHSFREEEFIEFRRRLHQETALLAAWLADGSLRVDRPMGGSELEAWLIDAQGAASPSNQQVLADLQNPMVVPELSVFNLEINSTPFHFGPGCLDGIHRELAEIWSACEAAANRQQAHMLMIGILPTIRQQDLCLERISPLKRYRALNEQVFQLRDGHPIELDISGAETLRIQHRDVMLEAATTSFQVHLKLDAADAARAFNLAKMISGPMVASCSNSPFLFGRNLWAETRIPLFEQAVAVGGSDYSKRVTFGIRYTEQSILEVFEANRDRYPVLLPQLMDTPPESLAHLRLHNGTIWRWNRPLIGFSEDGTPHVRLEHRVVPSGPSPIDCVANAAFHFGLMSHLLATRNKPEQHLPFEAAKANFYGAARDGLEAEVEWFDGVSGNVRDLCLVQLLPQAQAGLERLGVPAQEAAQWLEPVVERLQNRQTGSAWQRQWIATRGPDFASLVLAYQERQQSGQPVHRWSI